MIDEEGRAWPDDPTHHILTPPKKRKVISDDWKYRRRSPFYKLESWILRIIALIFLPIGNFWRYRFAIRGRKYVRKIKHKGALVVANHVLNMDAAIISSSIFRSKKLNFIILGENATIPIAGKLITALGGIPIADDIKGTKKFYSYCGWLLRKRKPILVFPEKALWHGYKGIRPFDKGAFTLATKNNKPVLPVVITLKNRKTRRGSQKYRVYFNIQPPIYPNSELTGSVQAQDLCDRTHQVFEEKAQEFYFALKNKQMKKMVKKQQKQKRKAEKRKEKLIKKEPI